MQSNPRQFPGPNRRRLLASGLGVVAFATWPFAARAAHMLRTWPAGKSVPPLALSDVDGKPWNLAQLKGRPVLLNFWATWCEPCRAEMPSLELLATRYERDGLVVLSVNYQDPLPAIKRFVDSLQFSLPILLDPDGAATAAWTPRVFPTTVLIDRNGIPLQSVVGELDWTAADARALVEPMLARAKPA